MTMNLIQEASTSRLPPGQFDESFFERDSNATDAVHTQSNLQAPAHGNRARHGLADSVVVHQGEKSRVLLLLAGSVGQFHVFVDPEFRVA